MSETNRLPRAHIDHPVWAALSSYDIGPSGAARRLIEDPRARRVHPRDAAIISKTTARLLLVPAGVALVADVPFW